jgi:hypothetical protein
VNVGRVGAGSGFILRRHFNFVSSMYHGSIRDQGNITILGNNRSSSHKGRNSKCRDEEGRDSELHCFFWI